MNQVADITLPQYPDHLIKGILRSVKTIAMVGASANDIRPSYFAMMYLLNKGYKVIPVNPAAVGKEILGQKVYASLKDVPAPVDRNLTWEGAGICMPIRAAMLSIR